MINIDFKIIIGEEHSTLKHETAIQALKPQELYDWLLLPDNYLKGGYCISVVNEPWNGYWDKTTKSQRFYIGHIDGALSFLKALNYFNSPNAKIRDKKSNICQCDGSTLEISLFANDAILLKDEAFGCEEMVTALPFFSFLFQEATNEFIKSISQVIDLCPSESELKTGLSYLLEQAKNNSIQLEPSKSALFREIHRVTSIKIPLQN